MTLDILPYEYFIQKSMELNRNEYKLPEYSQKKFLSVKRKLNIRNEVSKEEMIKPTTIGKKEEVIATLFKYFNKITDKTYDKLSKDIFDLVSLHISEAEKICNTFFNVILNNSFFCNLYARLYKTFIEIEDEFACVLEKQILTYVKSIPNIIYISPNEDYDEYCNYVKKVEGVKNFTTFLIQCFKQDIIKVETLLELAMTFQNCCLVNIDNEDKLVLNDIYISNIDIIVSHVYDNFVNEKWNSFIENINILEKSQGGGKNKKMHFKILDITDKINKK